MKKIEEGLHRVHALAGANIAEQPISDVSDNQETEALEPFLRVNLVSPGSPAETAVCIISMPAETAVCIISMPADTVVCIISIISFVWFINESN